ncbi:aldehyde dehydrogenase [Gordonia sp. MP11Mi]|uniref:Vanillin dehydrogenase n=1 Tax=Gordonia sp. MP11Mi TaxID=3022769 RepID=A0AA97GVG0_9ACTN
MTTISPPVPVVDLLINGTSSPATSGQYFETVDAATGETIAQVAAGTVGDARHAVDAAAAAFPAWAALPPRQRRAVLAKAAELLQERTAEIVTTMGREMGATAPWCDFNVHVAQGMLTESAAQAYSAVGDTSPSDVPGLTSMSIRQPAGVVIGIAPWNAPLILGVRAIAMPLVLGNTVVLKGSELTPLSQRIIIECLRDAGAPDGVVNFLTNAPEDAADVVEALIAHPQTARVNFTGSTRVGRIIAETAGRHLKRTVLELGGKAPQIVLADADIEEAAAAATFGAFMNQGQICMSTERIIVDATAIDEFAARLANRASTLVVGPPSDSRSQIGPVVHAGARDHVMELIADAKEKGADVLTGGSTDGLYIRPTVLRGVTPDMRIYAEESFGPVVSLIEVSGPEEAIARANDTEYGLTASVFSTNAAQALEVAKRIHSGMCHINSATVQDEPQAPFGGTGASGWGKFGTRAAVDEFTELRWVTIQAGSRHYPI